MSVIECKPNSNKYKQEQLKKEERPKINKVVSRTVKRSKNSGSKLADVFISEDVSNVKNYILMDVIVPAVKKAISDVITNGIDMLLYGSNGRTNANRSTASTISYNRYYGRDDHPRISDPVQTSRYSYDTITLDTRGEAEEVLARMDEISDTYKMVRVADFYDLVGVTGNYTDNKYGWTNIRNAEVIRVRDGYRIKLPRALPID